MSHRVRASRYVEASECPVSAHVVGRRSCADSGVPRAGTWRLARPRPVFRVPRRRDSRVLQERAVSPRRRLLVAVLVALVLMAAGVVGVRLLRAGEPTVTPEARPAQDRPGPVLLVPGYGGG